MRTETSDEEKNMAIGVDRDDVGRELRIVSGLPEPAVRREIREAAGLSQARLARAIGVSRGCIANWELGNRLVPRGPLLDKYVEALRKLKAEAEADGECRFSTAVFYGTGGQRGDIVKPSPSPDIGEERTVRTDYARYQPGHDDASLKPALWCLSCREDGNYQEDARLIWVQPEEETGVPSLADWMTIADKHETKWHGGAS